MIESADDTKALNRLQEVLRPSYPLSIPSGPTALLDYLYIGGFEEAEDLDQLRRLGITHVLNCAAEPGRLQRGRYASNPYPPESGIYAYDQFSALDVDGYDIMQHFPRAEVFINRAKYSGGKVLVHCAAGVNRSGVICVAYVMVDKKLSLFEAVRWIRAKRDVLLTNIGFRKQLVSFARRRGFL